MENFKQFVGLDASEGMLELFEQTKSGICKELVKLFLGLKSGFDAVTGSGILADNYLDCSVFEEMLMCLKTGGIACFATRTEYLEKYAYAPYMKKLEDEGRWKLVKNIKFGRYD